MPGERLRPIVSGRVVVAHLPDHRRHAGEDRSRHGARGQHDPSAGVAGGGPADAIAGPIGSVRPEQQREGARGSRRSPRPRLLRTGSPGGRRLRQGVARVAGQPPAKGPAPVSVSISVTGSSSVSGS